MPVTVIICHFLANISTWALCLVPNVQIFVVRMKRLGSSLCIYELPRCLQPRIPVTPTIYRHFCWWLNAMQYRDHPMYWSHERCSNFWCNCVGGSSFTAISTRGAILHGVQNYTRSRESDQGPQSKNLSGTPHIYSRFSAYLWHVQVCLIKICKMLKRPLIRIYLKEDHHARAWPDGLI